jgi:hypothetical protein
LKSLLREIFREGGYHWAIFFFFFVLIKLRFYQEWTVFKGWDRLFIQYTTGSTGIYDIKLPKSARGYHLSLTTVTQVNNIVQLVVSYLSDLLAQMAEFKLCRPIPDRPLISGSYDIRDEEKCTF